MVDYFSPAFVEIYGLRDGLILSGICEIAAGGREGGQGSVTSLELREKYCYFTKEQIRRALESLVEAGAVRGARAADGGFSRELCYSASAESMKQYLADTAYPWMPLQVKAKRGSTGRLKK
jgi:hypothetical protein